MLRYICFLHVYHMLKGGVMEIENFHVFSVYKMKEFFISTICNHFDKKNP